MKLCRLFVTGERTNVTFSPVPIRIVVSISHSYPRPLTLPFWIFRTLRTNHHYCRWYHHQHHHHHIWMTKKNELVATAHLKKKNQRRDTGRCKKRDKACREKEKSDRDKGMNANGEGRLSRQDSKDWGDQNTRFKVIILERWSMYLRPVLCKYKRYLELRKSESFRRNRSKQQWKGSRSTLHNEDSVLIWKCA